jgi:hypothetical protein
MKMFSQYNFGLKEKAPAAGRNRGWVNAARLTPAGKVTYPRKVEGRLARRAGRLANHGINSRAPSSGGALLPQLSRSASPPGGFLFGQLPLFRFSVAT